MDLKAELRARREYLLLLAIFLIALALRLTTAKYDYLLVADPWQHYHIAEELLKTGNFPIIDYYSGYPSGGVIGEPVGLYYLPTYLYKAVSFTDISFFKTFQALPAIFGTLSIIPLYSLAKELYNRKIAIFTILLFAISPAAIERALAGYYRGDVFFVFMMLCTFYFFVKSVKGKYYFSLFAAIFAFSSGLVWNGWPFIFGVLSLAFVLGMFVNYFKGGNSKNLVISYIVTCWLGFSLLYAFKYEFYRFTSVWRHVFIGDFTIIFKLIILASSFALLGLIKNYTKTKRQKAFGITLILVILIFFAFEKGYLQHIKPLAERLFAWNTAVRPASIYGEYITELQKPSLLYLIDIYNILSILAPIGLILLFKEKINKNTFTLAFIFSSLFTLTMVVRFTFLAAPAICFLGAFTLFYFSKLQNRRRVISVSTILMLLVVNTYAAINYVSAVEPFITPERHEALTWMKEGTPEDSSVLTWWHYSGEVTAIANRRTILGTFPARTMIEKPATFFWTSSEENALEIIKEKKVDYVLVDVNMYRLWPVILTYSKDENMRLSRSMLYQLYNKKDLKDFKLVFDNGDVKVYRPLYNYTRLSVFELDKYLYRRGDRIQFTIKTRSNEIESGKLRILIRGPKPPSIFHETYDVKLNSTMNIAVYLPRDSILGQYQVNAYLSGSEGKEHQELVRHFIVM